MIAPNPVVSLYRNPRSPTYLLEEYVENPRFKGTLTLWRERIQIGREEMLTAGLIIILKSFDEFRRRSAGAAFSPPPETPAEYRAFARKHLKISLRLLDENTLELDPDRRIRGGYQGSSPESRLVLSLPSTNSAFVERLDRAFAMAK